jgi:hypothetical protein
MSHAKRPPLADRLRAHRAEMELARAEGCSVLEARARIASRAASARWNETNARLQARINSRAQARSHATPAADQQSPELWWQRD